MTFYESVTRFEAKTGEKFYWKVKEGYRLEILPDNSFCQWKIAGNTFFIGQSAGSYKYWREFVRAKVLEHNCKYIITWTFRNPKACARQWKANIIREELDVVSNRKFYTLLAEVDKWLKN